MMNLLAILVSVEFGCRCRQNSGSDLEILAQCGAHLPCREGQEVLSRCGILPAECLLRPNDGGHSFHSRSRLQ